MQYETFISIQNIQKELRRGWTSLIWILRYSDQWF